MVRVLQSGRKTGDVGGVDGDFTWNESDAFIYAGTGKIHRSGCNLVVDSDRMVPGGCDGICLSKVYESENEEDVDALVYKKCAEFNPAHFLYSRYQSR